MTFRDFIERMTEWLTGLPIGALGERFGGVGGAAVSKTCARLTARIGRQRPLARRLRACERSLA